MRPQMPSAEQVAMLPALLVVTTPPQWQDYNGHINVRHSLELYDQAAWPLFATLGVDERYFKEQLQGVFDLQHHIWYLSELHVGDEATRTLTGIAIIRGSPLMASKSWASSTRIAVLAPR